MSEIKVDTLTGKTSAGDITVTSEGGAATQSLQQGLAKSWVNLNSFNTFVVRDSFANSSTIDNGTGNYTFSVSNNFSNTGFIAMGANESEYNHSRGVSGIGVAITGARIIDDQTTSRITMYSGYNANSGSNGSAYDTEVGFVQFMGDLA
jgi:hypothetical protein